MKEILDQLLGSQLLSEDTRNSLEKAITESLEQAATEARATALLEARAEVTKQWEVERKALVEAIEQRITTATEPHIRQLKASIAEVRDTKIALAKKHLHTERSLSAKVTNEMRDFAKDVDTFLQEVVAEELSSMKTKIDKIHEDNFGRRIYASFMREFAEKHGSSDALNESFATLRTQLSESLAENQTLRAQKTVAVRSAKLKDLLSPLQGETRKLMEAVLATVPTEKLDEAHKTYLSRVLKSSEKEAAKPGVLAESKGPKKPTAQASNVVTQGRKVTGDDVRKPVARVPLEEAAAPTFEANGIVAISERMNR